jgi:hypothetical protein
MADLVSMEKDDDDVLDHMAVNPVLNSKYPYHLRITLTHKELAKLGCDPSVAERGCMVEGHFIGEITDVHFPEDPKDEKCRCEIQIQELGLECEGEEEEEE